MTSFNTSRSFTPTFETFGPPSRSSFTAMSSPTPTPTPTASWNTALPSTNALGQSTDPWGVVWRYLPTEGYWIRETLSTASSSSFSSLISADVNAPSGSPPPNPNGLALPAMVGISVSSVLVIVAIITGCCWVRHRRNRRERRDARQMREIGVERIGAWTFESQPQPPASTRTFHRISSSPTLTESPLPRYPSELLPSHHNPHRQSIAESAGTSAWEDDSELDMLATDGSTLARTLSTRSTSSLSTIRTLQSSSGDRERLDHPGYTYRSNTTISANRSRSTPGSTFVSSRNGGLSPFADPTIPSSSSPTNTSISSDLPSSMSSASPITPIPRAAFRLSTTSSNNPFVDALPAYSIEETRQASANPFADHAAGFQGRDVEPGRAGVSDPPAYGELYRR